MLGHPIRVLLLMGKEPSGGQQGEVLHPGDLPDLLDVADLAPLSGDRHERRNGREGPAAGHRVTEPVGSYQVVPYYAEHFPLTAEQSVRAIQHRRLGLIGDSRGGFFRQDRGKPAVACWRRAEPGRADPASPASGTTPPGVPGHARATPLQQVTSGRPGARTS